MKNQEVSNNVHSQREKIVKQIESIEQSLQYLQILHPTNESKQRMLFLEGKIDEPTFAYSEVQIPPFSFPTLEGSHPLRHLYEERMQYIRDLVSIVAARSNDALFVETSERVFPVITLNEEDCSYTQGAYEGRQMPTEEIVKRFEETLEDCQFTWTVTVSASISSRLLVDKWGRTIFIHDGLVLYEEEVAELIRHEVGVHVLRFENGQNQPEPLLSVGTVKGELLEEGVALCVERPHDPSRIYHRHHAVTYARTHTFRETWEEMQRRGLTPDEAWFAVLRVKRGLRNGASRGAFTKDALYLQGLIEVRNFVANGGDIAALLSATVHFDEIPLLMREADFQVTSSLPSFLLP